MGWFKAEGVPRRKRRAARGRMETLKASTAKSKRSGAVPGGRWLLVKLLIGVVAIGFSLTAMGYLGSYCRDYISDLPVFGLRNVIVRVDGNANHPSVSQVRSWLNIKRGQSIFDVDIDSMRREFLQNAVHVRRMWVTRKLPDTLIVDVMERIAVARLGLNTGLVADFDGVVFSASEGASSLPLIVDYREGALAPGARVQGTTMAALQVAASYNLPGVSIEIVEIDASPYDYVTILTGQGKQIKLAWPHMGSATVESRKALEEKLLAVSKVLRSPRGVKDMVFDASLSGKQVIGSPGIP